MISIKTIGCSFCGAKPNEQCKTVDGYKYKRGNYIHQIRTDTIKLFQTQSDKGKCEMTINKLMNKYPKDVAVFSDPQDGVKKGYVLLEVLECLPTNPPFTTGHAQRPFLMGRDIDSKEIMEGMVERHAEEIRTYRDEYDEISAMLDLKEKQRQQSSTSYAALTKRNENTKDHNHRLETQISNLKKQIKELESTRCSHNQQDDPHNDGI